MNAQLLVIADTLVIESSTYPRVKAIECYRDTVSTVKDSIPNGATYYQESPVSNPLQTTFRIKFEDGSEVTWLVMVIDSVPSNGKEWKFESKDVSNVQGGVTEIRKWILG